MLLCTAEEYSSPQELLPGKKNDSMIAAPPFLASFFLQTGVRTMLLPYCSLVYLLRAELKLNLTTPPTTHPSRSALRGQMLSKAEDEYAEQNPEETEEMEMEEEEGEVRAFASSNG